jgi:hypothetical protein
MQITLSGRECATIINALESWQAKRILHQRTEEIGQLQLNELDFLLRRLKQPVKEEDRNTDKLSERQTLQVPAPSAENL